MSATIIPAGYRLTVKSWENYGNNNNNTKVLEGLSREMVAYYVELCRLFEYSYRDGRLCNMYDPSEKQMRLVYAALIEVAKRQPDIKNLHDGALVGLDDEAIGDAMMGDLDTLGLTNCEFLRFFTRVCESWKVEHIPVSIEMSDVTVEFL